jgi:hypothetical protein
MEKTAVQWLILEMNKTGFIFDKIDLMAFEQSKEMEKKQIIEAYRTGFLSDDIKLASDYYTETYNN